MYFTTNEYLFADQVHLSWDGTTSEAVRGPTCAIGLPQGPLLVHALLAQDYHSTWLLLELFGLYLSFIVIPYLSVYGHVLIKKYDRLYKLSITFQ